MDSENRGLTRRGFIGAAAAAIGAGTLATAGLYGCSNTQSKPSGSGTAAPADAAPAAAELNPQEDYTACTTDFAPLFEPLQIGGLTLKNRFVKSPAGSDTWVPEGDVLNDNYLDYYENFAKGGCSVVFTESAISKYFSYDFANHTTTGWFGGRLDKAKELMGPVVERVHKHDAYIGCQVGSPGNVNTAECSLEDLHWAQDTMVKVALAYKSAGFDMVSLHSSATQPTAKLLSTRFNTRTDEYGPDTLENRTRYLCEVIAKIKEACGPDFPIQILMNVAEENDAAIGENDGMTTIQESVESAMAFEKAGADSFYLRLSVPGLHVSQFAPDLQHTGYKCNGLTGYGTRFDYSQHFSGIINGQYSGCAMIMGAAAEFKKHLKVPVSCSGYMDPRTAPDLITNAVANGEVDYLMMTRPLTVDPEYPNKLKEGKRDEIAPCCRCMHCHCKGGPEGSGYEQCRVNAATQHAYKGTNGRVKDVMPEGYEPLPAATKKKVLVVGGGPSGMEAARIAALRGHEVTLYEKGGSLGGLIKTAHAFKGDHERLGDLVDYLAHQQEVHGVTVVTDKEVDAAFIEAEKPDAVVIAVGGKRKSELKANDSVKVVGVEDVAGADLGEKVVICGAGAQAVDIALYLLAQGKKIQMVHAGTKKDIDKEQSMWVRTYVKPQLYSQGVKIWSDTKVTGVVDDGLSIETGNGTKMTIPCDSVVEVYDMLPNTELFDAVSSKFEAYAVGDCKAPFNIADAILFGNLAGRQI